MTTTRKMRLGLSVANQGYHYAAWRLPGSPADNGLSLEHHLDCARIAEAGKLDFLFFADQAAVRNTDDPRIRRDMEQGHLKLEPTLLCAALAAATEHVGFVMTASTSYLEPYSLARRLASIDHISNGRAAWNLVTSTSVDEAQNFGRQGPESSQQRHERAAEFLAVMRGLWDSWDDDAFLRDKASGQYFDRSKFHFLEHDGANFKVRGPLDTARPPQGCLPVVTAGTSANSQDFAAEHADLLYSAQPTLPLAQEYYAAVKQRLAARGRDPDSLRVMTGIMPVVGRTEEEAQQKFRQAQDLLDPRVAHGMLLINHFPDLSHLPLDAPVPSVAMTGHHDTPGRDASFTLTMMERAQRERMTVRELFAAVSAGFWHLGVIGTPRSIADTMEQWFTQGAADGFIIQPPWLPDGGRDFVELVVPELQRRGLFRTEYEGLTLRENLGLPWVPSRHATPTAA
ncbi:LLM class flavin-dependent oxidoreductase [Roseomonas sp. 18066]|uniref:LLM class flavin-dependent oxidoreductase n=1 Tax=Roseomonas sp. 18066 TaxID=2681412 RepID=UPI00135689D7|nr:LLM class flavin-dependent oxidoreductase [Roseomonas sp. 18066]